MAINITRLFDFAYYQDEKGGLEDAFATKKNGVWEKTSTKDLIKQANKASRALLKLGIKVNDRIAIISSTNRTEWNIMDIGVLQIGAQNVPIYPTISSEDYEYIFNHAEVTYCFVSDDEVYQKAKKAKMNAPLLKEIYSFDEIKACKNWIEFLEFGSDESVQNEVEARKNAIKPTDLATFIYTSGTTGKPKGVMLSHQNVVSNVLSSSKRFPILEGTPKALSFLPVCHIFERMILYLYQYLNVSIYYAEGLDKISVNIKEVHPELFTVVPRLLEKMYDAIVAKGTELTGIKKALFFWALNLGLKYEPYGQNGWWYEFKLKIARKLIFVKWQAALGGKINTMVSGSAALQTRLTRVFCAAGIPVMEGYGLTETSPVISVNMQDNHMQRIGTVGKIIEGVEVKIADDGEILCKGPNVMIGYYKDAEKTAEVLENGYFHTGDKGEIDADGFLKITGRKKEIFKTSGGKYISPALLENEMKQSLFIEQILIIGENQKMPAAIIQPNFAFVKEWAKRHLNIEFSSNTDLIFNEKVIERIQEEIDKGNEHFGKWEKIKRFELTSDVWGVDNGLLTPTMKPKRDIIIKKYSDLYTKIYG
ncbi:MAG: long-chain fatty acid--CoA ligase [Flavobacteriales bacterium CG_4_8_14_3_um_filter_35_10]|nr:MAG: long-chain fatty acid--CoA ligase [Flavobacteriales bacterium CG11_big_fil_rev_8_21_14_0_20_35_7]PIX07732.1 MAG: long-chain fatty acid--CoA ligase [Flavobacteriales bacterium CG_4_8_14_3_um_filter_35_10]PJA05620.1 MAG: long-chain fatty acid--CoA ligase [Flavobacteriales bacterium CG_4_10_14_0_2_um_filter_35_18]